MGKYSLIVKGTFNHAICEISRRLGISANEVKQVEGPFGYCRVEVAVSDPVLLTTWFNDVHYGKVKDLMGYPPGSLLLYRKIEDEL